MDIKGGIMIHKGSILENVINNIKQCGTKYTITIYGVLNEYHDYLHISFDEDKKYYDL